MQSEEAAKREADDVAGARTDQGFRSLALAQVLFLLAGVSILWVLGDIVNGAAGLQAVAFAIICGSLLVSGTLAVALCKTTNLGDLMSAQPRLVADPVDAPSSHR